MRLWKVWPGGPLTCCCHWWSSLRPHPLLCPRRVPGGHRTVYIDVNLPELPPRNMASQVSAIARNELPATVSFSRGLKFTEGPSKFSPTFLDSILVNSTTANRLEAFSEAQSQALPSNFGSKDSQYYQSDQSDLLLHPVVHVSGTTFQIVFIVVNLFLPLEVNLRDIFSSPP